MASARLVCKAIINDSHICRGYRRTRGRFLDILQSRSGICVATLHDQNNASHLLYKMPVVEKDEWSSGQAPKE